MKKLRIAVYILICINVCALVLFYLGSGILDREILIGLTPTITYVYYSFISILFCCIVLRVLYFLQNKCIKSFIIMAVVTVFVAILFACASFIHCFLADGIAYYEFNSPDNQYTIIVYDEPIFMGGHLVKIYERVNPFFIEEKVQLSEDEVFLPLSIWADTYEMEWNDNTVTFGIATKEGEFLDTITIECGKGTG